MEGLGGLEKATGGLNTFLHASQPKSSQLPLAEIQLESLAKVTLTATIGLAV